MLKSEIEALKGIGPSRAAQLHRLGIQTVENLLFCLPRDYRDYSFAQPVSALRHGMDCAVRVRALSEPSTSYFHGISLVSVMATDGVCKLRLKWYNQPYRRMQIHPGDTVLACGRIDARRGVSMLNPSLSPELPGLVPVYPLSQGITQRLMQEAVRQALSAVPELRDPMPAALLERYDLLPLQEAVVQVHRPVKRNILELAQRRLAFDNVLYYLLVVEMRKRARCGQRGIAFVSDGVLERYLKKLPFQPTDAQMRVMDEIARDMALPTPMNRLLQGDVGSGKTAVALFALCIACANGYQGALMAPTEILAQQHFESMQRIFGNAVCYLHGGMKKQQRDAALKRIASGSALAVVGTHALLQEDVRFSKLGLVVTDEQHRFGVAQRATIASKGESPDVLVMSATPIPRTLALLLCGDLDISVIDQMPSGRKPVKTSFIPVQRRGDMYAYLARQAKVGVQSYVVCPFIEDSEAVEGVSAERLFEELRELLPGVRLALLHGRMSSAKKQETIEAFRSGAADILVTTTVIEVGVHVPNASIMVIEGADRFGLAQLHQLRGRVGRSDTQAYCFLLSESGSESTLERLSALIETTDGFVIAERDLEQRGPGDFWGVRQHGEGSCMPAGDARLLEQAAEAARNIVERRNAQDSELIALALRRYENGFNDIAMN